MTLVDCMYPTVRPSASKSNGILSRLDIHNVTRLSSIQPLDERQDPVFKTPQVLYPVSIYSSSMLASLKSTWISLTLSWRNVTKWLIVLAILLVVLTARAFRSKWPSSAASSNPTLAPDQVRGSYCVPHRIRASALTAGWGGSLFLLLFLCMWLFSAILIAINILRQLNPNNWLGHTSSQWLPYFSSSAELSL